MELFERNPLQNILPEDGQVSYYGVIMSPDQAAYYFDQLLHHIEWKHDEAVIYGKHYITKRKVAWYGDEPYDYSYSNTTKQALPWTSELLFLKKLVEDTSGHTFNSCLLNLYHEGSEGMAWHSDGEKMLGNQPIISSFTLGAERKFSFKHKQSKQTVNIHLENGSLLIMKGDTQRNWLHRLPPTKKVTKPRISLTFRTIIS
ncbi:DNA methylase [Echinicola pacifica]|uniref:DNA methylase n=1 Tax=Echinicola pacifica TaxID=346377 RepID=A0A918PNP6_9BACT|nr:alpha-ketoglutarate-dependent dioxygenase AlkB [Echinicola pacifica]GGZ15946.1 DNA methylase [Echinicola pacifica]